jgi:hypothetical protein
LYHPQDQSQNQRQRLRTALKAPFGLVPTGADGDGSSSLAIRKWRTEMKIAKLASLLIIGLCLLMLSIAPVQARGGHHRCRAHHHLDYGTAHCVPDHSMKKLHHKY